MIFDGLVWFRRTEFQYFWEFLAIIKNRITLLVPFYCQKGHLVINVTLFELYHIKVQIKRTMICIGGLPGWFETRKNLNIVNRNDTLPQKVMYQNNWSKRNYLKLQESEEVLVWIVQRENCFVFDNIIWQIQLCL